MKIYPIKTSKNQGVALPIILILLLVMTILGVTSLSSSTLQERMTASQRLREIAFNAAETTLREGEQKAKSVVSTIRRGNLPITGGGVTRLFAASDGVPATLDWALGWPSTSAANPGDTCTGGYCTPLENDNSGTNPAQERWTSAVLDVWNNANRHHVYANFASSGMATQGVFEAPKFIIEYLGQYPTKTSPSATPISIISACPTPTPAQLRYPFCDGDPHYFRITARAIAGTGGRQSIVTLQSTIAAE